MKSLQIKRNEINNFHFNIDLIKRTPKACTWLPKKNPKINSNGKDHGTYYQDCYARNQHVICFCTQNYV
jgi:hypothetical protein